jgi:hypothetical protein
MAGKIGLDPFRVLIGVTSAQRNSDLLTELASASGLQFDQKLSDEGSYSHKTRVRALTPRIVAAYDALDPTAALGAANALVAALSRHPDLYEQASDALRRIGWDIRDGELVVADPDLRQMFFPRGSRWDAYVVLRDLFSQASGDIVVVDPYCDKTIFELLASRSEKPLAVRILSGRSAAAVAGEAKAFAAQFPGWMIEVRQAAKDFHDRFIVVDAETCVHVGASINGAGKTAFMISRIEEPENRTRLLEQIQRSWSAATAL